MNKRVIVLGGDGFCGWPTSLYLSARGWDVLILDNLSRRNIDKSLGIQSLTPIASIEDRVECWRRTVPSQMFRFEEVELGVDDYALRDLISEVAPDAVVHFAEQRAAPYSMRNFDAKLYTVDNNVNVTHSLLASCAAYEHPPHIVHLGSMGVYGYGVTKGKIPEGYWRIVDAREANLARDSGSSIWALSNEILHPAKPGSVYHMTKVLDQQMFEFYARNDKLQITDLHQGIVWGTETDETQTASTLVNRFDYDGDYGTVLNRFIVQAVVGHPLTVHGTGGQTRAFIHIRDTVRCIRLALDNPPERGSRVQILNQMTECHRVRDLAKMISKMTGAEIAYTDNPRNEAAENELMVANDSLLNMGLDPTTLSTGLMAEIGNVALEYRDRVDLSKIPCTSVWTREQLPGVVK